MNTTMRCLVLAAAGITMLASASGAAASGETRSFPKEEITIDGKKPARFDHGKHINMGLDCSKCHHDAQHEGLTSEAIATLGDTTALKCVSCHNDSFAKGELKERKNVFHSRCRECHQQGYEGRKGPTKCNDCHLSAKTKKLEGC